MSKRFPRFNPLYLTAVPALVAAPLCAAETARAFDIAAQPMADALLLFSETSGIKVFFSSQLTKDINSGELKGQYTPQQALQKLLAGSSLQYRYTGSDTVTVEVAPSDAPSGQVDNATLQAVQVTGETTHADSAPAHPIYSPPNTVTATKTDTPIMETPQSIQVINRALMDDQQNLTISESLRNVSGVVPLSTLFTPATQGILIRGFAAEQVIDGFTQNYNPGDRDSTINVERLEVLKGTNGMLYSGGSGSPAGGLISVVSKLPQAKAFGEAGFKIGSYNFYQPFADINQPLNDNVLFRITGEYTNSGSHIDNIDTQRYNINPTLTFTDNADTHFTVQGKVSRWKQPEYQGLPATGTLAGNFRIRRETFTGNYDMPDSHADFDGVWGTLDHKFNETWSINLKARYAASSFNEKAQVLFGSDGILGDTPFFRPATWALVDTHLYQQQEELSFLGNATAKFDVGPTKNTVLIGADHSDFEDQAFTDMNMNMMTLPMVDLRNAAFSAAFVDPGPGIINQRMLNTTYGGYGQWQSTLFERLHLLGGVRIGTVAIDYLRSGSGTTVTDKTEWLPRVGGVIDIVDGLSVFADYSEGMRGQTYKRFIGTPQPESSKQAEAGLKINFASQLTGQLAVYQIDRSNVAVPSSANRLLSAPDGKQRSRGFEADLNWQATEALSLLATYAYTDARYVNNPASTGVLAGYRLARVPENSGRLWADYRFQQDMLRGFSIGGGVYVQSDAHISSNNQYKTPGFHSFDAALAYETKRYKVATSIKNLTDEQYFEPYAYLDGHVTPVAGTSVFATVSVKY
ncbi:MAG: TonB-dependent receptor [Methylococcaceae bacterium]|nr:TonB-dependent receptor [Methylococcaceae bacterium]